MKVLAIGAHPDDIEFGCGGSLVSFGKKGHPVFLFIVTMGEMGGAAAFANQNSCMQRKY